jgi:peptidoglycan/LPS O-acetylase OafA/YrhL
MNFSAASRCVRGLDRLLRETQPEKFQKPAKAPAALSDSVGLVIAVCAFIPVAAMMIAGYGWQHATLAALLGFIIGIVLVDMENWLRKPPHQAALFLTCAAILAHAVIMKTEHGLSDGMYLWLASGLLAGGAIAALATARSRPGKTPDTTLPQQARG